MVGLEVVEVHTEVSLVMGEGEGVEERSVALPTGRPEEGMGKEVGRAEDEDEGEGDGEEDGVDGLGVLEEGTAHLVVFPRRVVTMGIGCRVVVVVVVAMVA